jgi:hypothetical protein
MKLSNKAIDDLLTLVDHVRRDISYGEGGTYTTVDNSSVDKVAIKKAERAIDFIKGFIISSNLGE